ncbi:hypothetical protein ACH5RR_006598 [Cinchona calisaya]|uniref:WRKY domain-containing protein n=1 Tax=Cinchona calisaya TaxID=153742 RepID=A0ABD3APF3_9GENT
MDDNNFNKEQSSEDEEAALENSKSDEEFAENSQGGGGGAAGREWRKQVTCTVDDGTGAVLPPETLATLASSSSTSSSDGHCNFAEVPVEYGLEPYESAEELKDQVGIYNQEELKSSADQAAPAQTQNQQETPDGLPSSELCRNSVLKSISSIPSPILPEQRMSPVDNRNTSCVQQVENGNSFDPKTLSVVAVEKTPSPDGYNWRKYGQKQVKSPQGSRSYYRCTHLDCHAKKIECSDDSNCVMEIVYRSCHNHDPPLRVNCTRGRHSLSVAPVNGSDSSVGPAEAIGDSVPSTSSKDSVQETVVVPDPIQKESSGSDGNTEIDVKPEYFDESEPRKRLKKTVSSCSESLPKPEKKPKFVVHAAVDVGISGDGHRWRKYGQKMVKGNPHPRNYYRCTSAGCPVRKHTETAKDNTNAVIITYKGVHDHDMPVPKKRHGPPSAPLVAAAACIDEQSAGSEI